MIKHMSLRIRNKADEDAITAVQDLLHEATASKAIFETLRDYPKRLWQIDSLQRELEELNKKIEKLRQANTTSILAVSDRNKALEDLLNPDF